MARVFLTSQVNQVNPKAMKVVYSVDQPVGPGCPNRRDDTLLVQFLLKAASDDNSTFSPPFQPPGEKPIVVDGLFGRQTAAYIRFFQEEVTRRHPAKFPMVRDGRVDPLHEGAAIGNTGKMKAIIAMNMAYVSHRNLQIHQNIQQDPTFPQELGKSLYAGQ